MQPSFDEYTRMVTDLTDHDFSENQSTGLVTLIARLFAKEHEYFERIRKEDKEDRDRIRAEDKQDRRRIQERSEQYFERVRREDKEDRDRIRAEDKQDRDRIRAEDKQDRDSLRRWTMATLTALVFLGLTGIGTLLMWFFAGAG